MHCAGPILREFQIGINLFLTRSVDRRRAARVFRVFAVLFFRRESLSN
jgi:hypothetical protein